VAVPLLDSTTVVVTLLPDTPEGMALTTTPGSENSTLRLAVAVLFAPLLSGVALLTALLALRVTVAVSLGTVVVKLRGTLAPGARSPTAKACTTPLLSVTVPVTAVAVAAVAPLALLVKVAVTVTTEPAGALAGRVTAVVTSANSATPTWVLVLLALLLSGTVGAVTLAVTVEPVAVTGTVMGAVVLLWAGARVTGARLLATPLITTCGVKVTVAAPLLDSTTVVVTLLPDTPEGMALTNTPGSENSTLRLAVAVLFAPLLSGVALATTLPAVRAAVAVSLGTVVVKLRGALAPGARSPTAKACTTPLLSVTVPVTAVAVAAVAPLALLVKVAVTVTTEPAGALAGRVTAVVTSANSTARVAVPVLLALTRSAVVVVTVLVALSTVVAVVAGTVVVKFCTELAPGARLPATKARTSPLDKVTVPATAVAVVAVPPAVLLRLVKVTVPETTDPAGALAGRLTVDATSA